MNQKLNKLPSAFYILILSLFFLFNCANGASGSSGKTSIGKYAGVPYAVLSTLFNNRMLLLLKLTYATDAPLNFSDYNNGTGQLYQDVQDTGAGGDPAFDLFQLPLAQNLNFFIDIGEIRISSKIQQSLTGLDYGVTSITASKKYWDFIATQRQVYCSAFYSLGGNSCDLTSKTPLVLINQLFNGEGAKFPSNDPTATIPGNNGGIDVPTKYYASGIYVRSFVTGWARQNGGLITNTIFDNNQIITGGQNIVPRNNYLPGTTDTDKSLKTPFMFPVFHALKPGQEDMSIRGGADPYILEVRMNIKENLMVHSYTTTLGFVQTFIGISDWRYNHSGQVDSGGNILSRSRIIYPETASSLQITGGTRSLQHYYNVFRDGETELVNELPLASTPVKQGTSNIKYIHSGSYILVCAQDRSPVDGYPETVVRSTKFSVPETFRQTITVNLACP
ncbi:MAG TPA: hypothetical protein PK079_21765 [Leptospiraceae bacterium]|nr:hypothetical protein [Leptospiraceae bacterium]HMX35330.1 hypothetical protein [Leptospiraceae bacterium]HMY33988.1 hypothetical protein [Leptospiraceae bacterium]HMZ66514.1 hypothetical protein [Leptospiraceae bacterium]HNA09406.1 hypothetical protein [Leptospiraceae bacterium]